jgi:hypothetical protein
MPKTLTQPDHLFDRTWRPGHPFRPRLSQRRRWGMLLLFVLLCSIIGGYWYLTDARRVRAMAESYLSNLIGGQVRVGNATLSIFEGLRLDNVTVYVDSSKSPDSAIFSAQTFLVRYNPRSLLNGRLEATQIVAIDPHVWLTEDLDTGHWNYERLAPRRGATSMPTTAHGPVVLPEILLRNAMVNYTQMQGGKLRPVLGSIGIEGQFTPGIGDRYGFKLQSRGLNEGLGPEVSGELIPSTRQIRAQLHGFEFGKDVEAMLPAQVRTWWKEHKLAGRVDVPELSYNSTPDGTKQFKVEIVLNGVTLSVHPEEWTSREELERREMIARGFDAMRNAGLNYRGYVDRLANLIEPSEIALQKVNGTFIFTQDGITLKQVFASVENNAFKINGKIVGYNRSPAMDVTLASSAAENIYIPPSPRYINSMPPPVRELYDHLRPQGTAAFWMRVTRDSSEARPEVAGEVDIIDGNFVFDRFAYPIRHAQGKIAFGRDQNSGIDKLELDLHGYGVANGPNRDSMVSLDGTIAPLGADPGVTIQIRSGKVTSEPAMFAAFPKQTRDALKIFDAEGKGEYPKFSGSFVCDVIRPVGPDQHWTVNTDIKLADAEGALIAFPYPMKGVHGDLKVREDHVEIINAKMKRGDAELTMNGRVDWGDPLKNLRPPKSMGGEEPPPSLRPELTITAKNVPIDQDLLKAMPPGHRKWLETMGVTGTFDLDGTVTSMHRKTPGSNIDFAFDIDLHNASLLPVNGKYTATNIAGKMRLTPMRVVINNISARRGEGTINTKGEVAWPNDIPQIALTADARNITLDKPLYDLLPEAGKRGWDAVRPEGTVDAQLAYSGVAGKIAANVATTTSTATTVATTQPSTQPVSMKLVIVPRTLSVTPTSVPYRLDNLQGEVTIQPDRVTFTNLHAKHGDANFNITATGLFGDQGKWDFQLKGDQVTVDEALRKALPDTLGSLIESSKMKGKVGFEFSKLIVTPSSTPAPKKPATPATTNQSSDVDVDFACNLNVNASSLDIGVPIENVQGVIALEGSAKRGKLDRLGGHIDVPSFTLAQRPVTNFRADLMKNPGNDAMQLDNMQARIADGELAGRIGWISPDVGAARYALEMALRNADVTQLAGETAPDVKGQLSASVALEGNWSDPNSRRGRGDVSVTGDKMYKIPVVLGLLQITNLSLPITSPFNEANCRYSVDGQRVSFESIELRAKEMMMQGNGHLDFGTKQVKMTFVTDSTTWPKIPIVGDLLQGARHELLQIHVQGTLEEPKVSASMMNTFTTTIDKVFRGSDNEKKK